MGLSDAAGAELLERDAELATIGATLTGVVEEGGRLVVIRAPAGMGKSRLLGAAADEALTRGFTVLAVRGSELERSFPLGLVRQLFDPLMRSLSPADRERALSGAAELARPLLGQAEQALPLPPARSSAGLYAMYSLLANLSDERPVALLVDDAHWADEASLAFLAFLLPRLHDLSVALLVAIRAGEPRQGGGAVDAIEADPAATRLTLAPLSDAAVSAILGCRIDRALESAFAAACREVTGGNPFYLQELCLALDAAGLQPMAANIPRVQELGPEGISRAVLVRIGRAADDPAPLARSLAVLGDGTELRLAAALADLGIDQAATAADALSRAEVLADERPLRFVHPIVRTAIANDLTAAERASTHSRAARVLAADGALAEQVAGHLLESERLGDSSVVEQLRAAARLAIDRGAPATATRYLSRALEEPAGALAPDVLRELGAAELSTGDPAAVDHLEQAWAAAKDARGRAEAARDLARAAVGVGNPERALVALRAALETLGEDDPELALALSAELSGVALLMPSSMTSVMEPLLRYADAAGTTPAERVLLADLAHWLAATGRSAERCAELALRALAEGRLAAETRAESPSFYHAVFVLIAADRFSDARRCLDDTLDMARDRGSTVAFAFVSTMRSLLEYRVGRLAEAEAEARGAIEAVRQQGWPRLPLGVAFVADALIERGRLAEAERVLQEGDGESEAAEGMLTAPLLAARGRLRIASGELATGVEDLLEWGRRSDRAGGLGTAGTPTYRTYAAPALAALGRRGEARRLISEELDKARAWGAGRAIGMALYAAGLVEPGEKGETLLAEAVDFLQGTEARLEHARALIELGAAQRRAGRAADARAPLREGMDLAQRCGAEPLVVRAREELAASGVRRRPRTLLRGIEALTPSERRVAAMAAAGRTNREIAQALRIARKTVEMHLSGAYRKLDIDSRAKLPDALSQEAEEAEAAPG